MNEGDDNMNDDMDMHDQLEERARCDNEALANDDDGSYLDMMLNGTAEDRLAMLNAVNNGGFLGNDQGVMLMKDGIVDSYYDVSSKFDLAGSEAVAYGADEWYEEVLLKGTAEDFRVMLSIIQHGVLY